jgi:hypothetical protein
LDEAEEWETVGIVRGSLGGEMKGAMVTNMMIDLILGGRKKG